MLNVKKLSKVIENQLCESFRKMNTIRESNVDPTKSKFQVECNLDIKEEQSSSSFSSSASLSSVLQPQQLDQMQVDKSPEFGSDLKQPTTDSPLPYFEVENGQVP